MSLETTFETLRRELGLLQEAVSSLHVTATEDKPVRGEVALVSRLEDVITDLVGTLEGAVVHAAKGVHASQQDETSSEVRIALRDSHDLINRFARTFYTDLATHESIAQLLQMGRERGKEWRSWTGVVKTAIEHCAVFLSDVQGALLECWDELTERLAAKGFSIRSTNIGQQITMQEDKLNLVGNAT
jgi:hypothetical protein